MSAEHLENEHRDGLASTGEATSDAAQEFDDETQGDANGALLEPRVSLWTVPEKWGGGFFVLLVAQSGALIGLHAWRAVVSMPNVHVVDTVLSEVLAATPILVFAGILSMIELEVALTLSRWYERRSIQKDEERYEAGFKDGQKRGRERGIEEGRLLERERVMAELASQSNGDVGA